MKHRNEQKFIEKCQEFGRLYGEGRIEECVDRFYAPDAILEGTGLPPQVGRKMIRALYEEVRTRYERIEMVMDALGVADDIAYCRQANVNYCMDGSIERHKGLMIWNMIDNDWFVKFDLFYFLGDSGLDYSWLDKRPDELQTAAAKFHPL